MTMTAAAPARTKSDPNAETAIALREVSAPPSPYDPRDYEQAIAMSKVLSAAAKISPEEAFLKMATGRDLGISATTALRMVDCIPGNGKIGIGLRAQLMVALCQRAKTICEYFHYVEGDDKSCTYATKRVDEKNEQRETYTIEQAKTAKLIKSDGAWATDPQSQLIARASSRLARRVYPDLMGGIYTPEELAEANAVAGPREVGPISPTGADRPRVVRDAVIEGEVVEKKPEPSAAEQLEALEAKIGATKSKAELDAIAGEIVKAFPVKDGPERRKIREAIAARTKAGFEAPKAAQEGEPDHDPVTGVVREAGQEG